MAKAEAVDSKGEPLYPPPLNVAPVAAVRGSVIVLDWLWLREHGHFDRYRAALGAARDLLDVTATQWVPFPLGAEHWRALHALALPAELAYELGKFNAERKHNVVLNTMMRLAGQVGVTPWVALAQCHKLWLHAWQGGGMAVYRAGEHAARIEFLNHPLLSYRQLRNGLRGAIAAGIAPFCRAPAVHELNAEQTPSSMVVRATWKP